MNQEHTLKLLESEKAKKLLGELRNLGRRICIYSVLQDGPRSAATIPITTMERY